MTPDIETRTPKPGKSTDLATSKIRLRNKAIRRVVVADLEDAPWNFRAHPKPQRDALEGAIDELGFYGYPDVYETPDGKLRICDGHLRKELLIAKYGEKTEIEVNVTDFDEAEAKKATLTKDPLAAMAEANSLALDSLLREVETGSEGLAAMLAALAEEAGIIPNDNGETELRPLSTQPPPKMTWVLVGIPTVRFGEINQTVEHIAAIAGTIVETTANDG